MSTNALTTGGLLFWLVALSISLSSCCSAVDCASETPFSFTLLNKVTGKDLVYEEAIPLAEFTLTDISSGSTIAIHRSEASSSLYFLSDIQSPNYQISYQSRSVTFSITFAVHASKCCDDYSITGTTGSADVSYDDARDIFVVRF